MRLLKYDKNGKFSFTVNFVGTMPVPPYAILSHTWGPEGDEITYTDILNLRDWVKGKPGFVKLRFCAEQAAKDGLGYFWVDTCCINKFDSTELSEAINSMFSWYAKAAKCYVYLSDVDVGKLSNDRELGYYANIESRLSAKLRTSRWFSRGWTLQELLAPRDVRFFSSDGICLFDKKLDYKGVVHEVTGIPAPLLRGEVPLKGYGVEERFGWAASRQTTRPEDAAYCMLGIFDVFIPLIYGEGRENALHRLRRAIDEKEYPPPRTAIVAAPQGTEPRIVTISSERLQESDLVEVLRGIFPDIPRERMQITEDDDNYIVLLPRDLTEGERDKIANKRGMSFTQMAAGAFVVARVVLGLPWII